MYIRDMDIRTMYIRTMYIRSVPIVKLSALIALPFVVGCGLSTPVLGYVKSPEEKQCTADDCPTIEIPAPNDDTMFNPVSFRHLDDKAVSPELIFANKGRVWWIMKVNPGKHSLKVMPDTGATNIIGTATTTEQALEFEAKPGQRYWVFLRPGAGGYSAKPWIESSEGDREVLAGERKLDPHNIAASIFLEGEANASEPRVEMWWKIAPAAWNEFARAEKKGSVPPEEVGKPPGPRGAAKAETPAAEEPPAAEAPAEAKPDAR